jgi:hypothetical protein
VGPCADHLGHCHWTEINAEQLPGGGLRASRSYTWANDPADSYAEEHPAPLAVKWRHRTTIGRVVALVRRNDCLDAVGEITADADTLADLADALAVEGVRWSSATERRGRGPLVIRELTLAPASAVASVGLPDVRFSTGKDTPPRWVRDALLRSKRYVHHRDRSVLRVCDDEPRWIDGSPIRSRTDNPREIRYSAAVGEIIAVNGRPVDEH